LEGVTVYKTLWLALVRDGHALKLQDREQLSQQLSFLQNLFSLHCIEDILPGAFDSNYTLYIV
jgi:hypothetical protein